MRPRRGHSLAAEGWAPSLQGTLTLPQLFYILLANVFCLASSKLTLAGDAHQSTRQHCCSAELLLGWPFDREGERDTAVQLDMSRKSK